jgi:4-hydroxythreonine-4-phosphate dehydrogenase
VSAPPVLAVTVGDAAGIGPEIVLRVLANPPPGLSLLVVGDAACLRRDLPLVSGARVPAGVASPEDLAPGTCGLWTGSAPLAQLPDHGAVSAPSGAASHAWVVQAADLALAGRVDAVVTGPIHKGAWHAAGIRHPGHTEVLRERAGGERVLMMLVGGRLRAALATIHVPLRCVPDLLETGALTRDLELLARETARGFGPARPRLAVCGLNPHAGEEGLFGREDLDVIAPAVRAARAAGVDAHGPLPADACIPATAQGAYDAVLAMYHDQALPAVKSLAPRRGVNVTLGLPFVRTSVDHGTAFDRAGRGHATDASLREALALAAAIAARRAEFDPAGA